MKEYGDERGLNAPPRRPRAPASLMATGRRQEHLGSLHRARTCDDDELGATELDFPERKARWLGREILGSQLVRLHDGVDGLHARNAEEGHVLEPLLVADAADDRAALAAGHVGPQS